VTVLPSVPVVTVAALAPPAPDPPEPAPLGALLGPLHAAKATPVNSCRKEATRSLAFDFMVMTSW
jgi:hypothetical protein